MVSQRPSAPRSSAHRKERFLGKELLFWLIATAIGVVAAVATTDLLCQIVGMETIKRSFTDFFIGLLSLTWGSWAALLWTRRRPVRTLLGITTQMPSLWMIAIGTILYFFGQLTVPITLILIGGGLTLAYLSRRLTQTVRTLGGNTSVVKALVLSTLHPIVTAFTVGGFLFMWIHQLDTEPTYIHEQTNVALSLFDYATNAIAGLPDFGAFLTDLTWKSVLAISIISTIIPAVISELFSRMLTKQPSAGE